MVFVEIVVALAVALDAAAGRTVCLLLFGDGEMCADGLQMGNGRRRMYQKFEAGSAQSFCLQIARATEMRLASMSKKPASVTQT